MSYIYEGYEALELPDSVLVWNQGVTTVNINLLWNQLVFPIAFTPVRCSKRLQSTRLNYQLLHEAGIKQDHFRCPLAPR